jgi:hypothetical protein
MISTEISPLAGGRFFPWLYFAYSQSVVRKAEYINTNITNVSEASNECGL